MTTTRQSTSKLGRTSFWLFLTLAFLLPINTAFAFQDVDSSETESTKNSDRSIVEDTFATVQEALNRAVANASDRLPFTSINRSNDGDKELRKLRLEIRRLRMKTRMLRRKLDDSADQTRIASLERIENQLDALSQSVTSLLDGTEVDQSVIAETTVNTQENTWLSPSDYPDPEDEMAVVEAELEADIVASRERITRYSDRFEDDTEDRITVMGQTLADWDNDGYWDYNDDEEDDDYNGREYRNGVRTYRNRSRGNGGSRFITSDYNPLTNWYADRWTIGELGVYRTQNPIRYNRVDGLVLGFAFPPLDWNDYSRGAIYGSLSYAFGLEKFRYEIGAETMPGRRGSGRRNVKLGGSWYRNTYSNDNWKIDWLENSISAIVVKNDYMDYYEIEGWTGYVSQRLGRWGQLTVAFRQDDYTSLAKNITWSLFDGDGFGVNPLIDEGRMQSVVVSLDGGGANGSFELPTGFTMHAEAEFAGEELGFAGDFDFQRYQLEGRIYIPTGSYSRLMFRARGDAATENAPIQKQSKIGGLGTMRAFAQNSFVGHRSAVVNAEFFFDSVFLFPGLLEDEQIFFFGDAGWVGDATAEPKFDEFHYDAGFGIALADRMARFEVAWSLGEDFQSAPVFWFRLNPTF